MTVPDFDTSSLNALRRSAMMMQAFVQALLTLACAFPKLPVSLGAFIEMLDTSLCRIEDLVFDRLEPSDALEHLRSLRTARDLAFAEETANAVSSTTASDDACAQQSQHAKVPSTRYTNVTPEMRSVSGGPSLNRAARAPVYTARRLSARHHPYTDHTLTITPQARPQPTHARSPDPFAGPAHSGHRPHVLAQKRCA